MPQRRFTELAIRCASEINALLKVSRADVAIIVCEYSYSRKSPQFLQEVVDRCQTIGKGYNGAIIFFFRSHSEH